MARKDWTRIYGDETERQKRSTNRLGNTATRVLTQEGAFDSKREFKRWGELQLMRKAGEIRNLRRQVSFYFGDDADKWVRFDSGRRMCYRADFVYEERTLIDGSHGLATEEWKLVVEDCKGFKTEVYLIKKALMLFFHDIEIRETR